MKHLAGAIVCGAFALTALPAVASGYGKHYRPNAGMGASIVLASPGISFSVNYPGAWYAPYRDWRPPRHREWGPGHWKHHRARVPGYWKYRNECNRDHRHWRHERRDGHEHRPKNRIRP